MLRVIHVIPSLQKGGAERLMLDICNELQKKDDVKVKIIILHDVNEYKFMSENLDIDCCNSFVLPSMLRKTKVDLKQFDEIVNDFKPNIIHSHLFEAELVSRWNVLPNVKYFTHCHDNIVQFKRFSFKTILKKICITNYYERFLLFRKYKKCKNNFIAISKHCQKFLIENLPRGIKKITLLPNSIDYERFYDNKKKETPNNIKLTLVNVGSFVDKKNQIFLLDVVKILKNKNIDIHLNLCGDGKNRAKIEKEIISQNLEKNISILGKVENVEKIYKNADVYVHSATYEPFGLVLIEAMASGLPVVSLNGGGNVDIIENGKNGFLIEEQDAEMFSEKILELVNCPEKYSQISDYAKNYAKNYDIKSYLEKLICLYKKP